MWLFKIFTTLLNDILIIVRSSKLKWFKNCDSVIAENINTKIQNISVICAVYDVRIQDFLFYTLNSGVTGLYFPWCLAESLTWPSTLFFSAFSRTQKRSFFEPGGLNENVDLCPYNFIDAPWLKDHPLAWASTWVHPAGAWSFVTASDAASGAVRSQRLNSAQSTQRSVQTACSSLPRSLCSADSAALSSSARSSFWTLGSLSYLWFTGTYRPSPSFWVAVETWLTLKPIK